MGRTRRAVAAAAAVAMLGVWTGTGPADAAEPTVGLSGTVLGATPGGGAPRVLPTGSNFLAATTSCADEARTFSPAAGVTSTGVLLAVQADGSFAGQLVAGCTYNLRGASLLCGGLAVSPIQVVEAASEPIVAHLVVEFATPPPLEAEPDQVLDGSQTLQLVDTSRPVDLWPCTFNEERSLPTSVYLPEASGPRPLIVVGHGLGSWRGSMHDRGVALAAAGYVVAIPSFASRQSSQASRDLPNQPGDVSFVIDELLRRGATAGDPLEGRIDGEHIGMSGVSGGAITALLFFNTCCRDDRIDAIHAEMGFFLGAPLVTKSLSFKYPIPLLMANNRGDGLIPFANAAAGWDQAKPDKYLVSAPASGCSLSHCLPEGVGGVALVPFFDAYLDGDAAARQQLVETFSQPSDPDGIQWSFKLQKEPSRSQGPKPR